MAGSFSLEGGNVEGGGGLYCILMCERDTSPPQKDTPKNFVPYRLIFNIFCREMALWVLKVLSSEMNPAEIMFIC
jgi:hypothetical protein